jgi:hypothetical protein
VLARHFPEGTEEKPLKASVRIADLRIEILNPNVLNARQEY